MSELNAVRVNSVTGGVDFGLVVPSQAVGPALSTYTHSHYLHTRFTVSYGASLYLSQGAPYSV